MCDDYLQKITSYKELIHHTNDTISDKWMMGGEKDSVNFLMLPTQQSRRTWHVRIDIKNICTIKKKTVTYPRYTTAV